MARVRVLSPQAEPEVLVAAALLEAHQIPAFIHNRGKRCILPGAPINAYNTQSILVPEGSVLDAVELLAKLKEQPRAAVATVRLRGKVGVLLEELSLDWFVPGSRSRATEVLERHYAEQLAGAET